VGGALPNSVSAVLTYDKVEARRVAAIYRTQEIAAQRGRVLAVLAPRPGERVLDIGCGPGYLACDIAAQLGGAGQVTAIDVSEEMLTVARTQRARSPAGATIELHRADATALPLDQGSFDAAVATQTYEFVHDIPRALGELYRVLRPGGRALILDTDWDSIVWHSTDRARMQRVLDAWKQRLAHPHLPRTLAGQLRQAGFDIADREALVIFEPEGRTTSYSARQIDHIAAATACPNGLSIVDSAAWAADLKALTRSKSYFFSINRYLFLATKPAVA
jgi:arsenite methyltransferase